jgi:ribonuclease HI
MRTQKIIIYCDGACSGNQFKNNVGGWGAVIKYGDHIKKIYGGEHNTSNQRMEITACIKALEMIKKPEIDIEVFSDSAYLVNCIQQKWYEKWIRNGWKTSKKDPVENKDLWMKLLALLPLYKLTFHKVEGHAGNELNELADQLAQKGISEAKKYH